MEIKSIPEASFSDESNTEGLKYHLLKKQYQTRDHQAPRSQTRQLAQENNKEKLKPLLKVNPKFGIRST